METKTFNSLVNPTKKLCKNDYTTYSFNEKVKIDSGSFVSTFLPNSKIIFKNISEIKQAALYNNRMEAVIIKNIDDIARYGIESNHFDFFINNSARKPIIFR